MAESLRLLLIWLGMLLFRHKIRKAPFPVLVPLFFLLQAALTAWTALR